MSCQTALGRGHQGPDKIVSEAIWPDIGHTILDLILYVLAAQSMPTQK